MPNHPTPWEVRYYQRFSEWDPRSSPRLFDANGKLIFEPRQHTAHPGMYDALADELLTRICNAVNQTKLQHSAWIVNCYSGTAELALEKSYDDRLYLIKDEADKLRDELNAEAGGPVWRTIEIAIQKA